MRHRRSQRLEVPFEKLCSHSWENACAWVKRQKKYVYIYIYYIYIYSKHIILNTVTYPYIMLIANNIHFISFHWIHPASYVFLSLSIHCINFMRPLLYLIASLIIYHQLSWIAHVSTICVRSIYILMRPVAGKSAAPSSSPISDPPKIPPIFNGSVGRFMLLTSFYPWNWGKIPRSTGATGALCDCVVFQGYMT